MVGLHYLAQILSDLYLGFCYAGKFWERARNKFWIYFCYSRFLCLLLSYRVYGSDYNVLFDLDGWIADNLCSMIMVLTMNQTQNWQPIRHTIGSHGEGCLKSKIFYPCFSMIMFCVDKFIVLLLLLFQRWFGSKNYILVSFFQIISLLTTRYVCIFISQQINTTMPN